MIRPVTCVCMLLAASSGLYLYQTKHRTRMLDKTIEATVAETESVHERTRLLNAEWALLNDPSRLGDLAGKFLTLRPVAPNQFVTMAELEKHLPAVREFAPSGALPAEPPPEVPMAASLPTQPPPPAHPPATAPARPTQLAAAATPKPSFRPASEPAEPKPEMPLALPAPRPLARAPTRREPAVAALPAPHSASVGAVAGPLPTPVSNPVMMNPVLSRVIATNTPPAPNATVQPISRIGYSGSVLGNARMTLAPPVPVSSTDSVGSSGTR
jgi:hypothetical protein